MCDVMTFPDSVDEFIEKYGIRDTEEVYTNGSLLIPVFRVEQMIDHYFRERTCHVELNEGRNAVVCSECGSSALLESLDKLIDWGGNEIVKTFRTFPCCPNCGSKVVEK